MRRKTLGWGTRQSALYTGPPWGTVVVDSDKTPKQRATDALVALTQRLLPSPRSRLRLPRSDDGSLIAIDELIREGLFDSPVEA